ncbi:MAG: alpha/beta hydrolase [Planctomycetota bacterium]|nr:alpha/beta hydrolase [Planctomycetota bacterium]
MIATPLVVAACSSLPKSELELRLADLSKNAPIGSLDRLFFNADLGQGDQAYELVYHRAPSTSKGSKRTPVVLVHGTPSTLYSWSELIYGVDASSARAGFEGLNADRDVYAIEIVGHGVAPEVSGEITFERCARFVSAAIRALDLEQVQLVGSSYGGEFAWRAALNEPDLIQSLVLIDSSGVARREADWLPEEVAMRDNPLAKIGWVLNSRDRIDVALAPHFDGVPPDRTEEFFLVCDNSSNWKGMVDLARDENGDREGELAELSMPTLLLWGAEDLAYSPGYYAQRFDELIEDSQLTLMPGIGHYPHEQAPSEVVGILEQFFQGVEVQP